MPSSPGLYVINTLISFFPSIRNARINVWTNKVTLPEAWENGGCRSSIVKKELKKYRRNVSSWKLCFAFEICPIEWKQCWRALPYFVWHWLFLVRGGVGPSFKRGLDHRRLTWCLWTATVAEEGIETWCLITHLSRLRILQELMFSHKQYRWNITSMSFLLSFSWDLCCGIFFLSTPVFRFYCLCPPFTTASLLVGNTPSYGSRVSSSWEERWYRRTAFPFPHLSRFHF